MPLSVVIMEKHTQSMDCAAMLTFQHFGSLVELPNIGHVVAPTYLGKVTEVFPLTPSGLEMVFKRSVWGYFYHPQLPL